MEQMEVDNSIHVSEDTNLDEIYIMKYPDEIYLMIFEYLTPKDRRLVSLSCKKFLNIWYSRIFQGDRNRIVIHGRVLEDEENKSWQVLLESEYIITELVLKDVSFSDDLEELWKKLGKTVTRLELKREKYCEWPDEDFWKHFSNLKVLKLELKADDDYEYLPKSIEKIIITKHNIRGFKKLVNDYIRQNKQLSLETFGHVYSKLAKFYSKIRSFDLDASDGKVFTNVVELLQQNFLKPTPSNIFEIIESKYPSLNCLDLLVSQLPPKNVPYLKKMSLMMIKPKEYESKLHLFENLEELDLFIKTKKKCFFTHTPFLNKNMKSMTVNLLGERKPSCPLCNECVKTMATSYPNLETLHLPNGSNKHLKIIQAHLPNLKHLALTQIPFNVDSFMIDLVPNLTALKIEGRDPNHLDENFPRMDHLRKLKIKPVDLNLVEMFVENTPGLEELEINIDDPDESEHEEILELIVKNLKLLTKLTVNVSFKFDDVEKICKMLVEHCKFMKELRYEIGWDWSDYSWSYFVLFKDSKYYIKKIEEEE